MLNKLSRYSFLLLPTLLCIAVPECLYSTYAQEAAPAAEPAPAAEAAAPAEPAPPPPPPQSVEIAVEIFEYRLSEEEQFGLMYEYIRERGDLLDFNLFLPGTTNPGDPSIPALQTTVDLLNSRYGDLDATLQAAVSKGQAMILSNPRLVVKEGNPASIVTGEKVPITKLEIKGANQTLATVDKHTGVKLYVTPQVLNKDYILLALQAEVSEIVSLEKFTPSDSTTDDAIFELPRVQRRTVQTTVLVPDGFTLFIGGLLRETKQTTDRKIPILGDIPYAGFPFKSKNETSFNSDTWFKITPTILERGKGGSLPMSSVGGDLGETFLDADTVESATDERKLEENMQVDESELIDYDKPK